MQYADIERQKKEMHCTLFKVAFSNMIKKSEMTRAMESIRLKYGICECFGSQPDTTTKRLSGENLDNKDRIFFQFEKGDEWKEIRHNDDHVNITTTTTTATTAVVNNKTDT